MSLDRSDFLHALNKVQKLQNLAVQIQNGWTSEQIKRLMLHAEFQDLLKDVRTTQTKYRLEHPGKQRLLMFPFHKVIGLDSNFDFDVSAPDPPWMDANEDGVLIRKRSRTPVQPAAPADAGRVQPAAPALSTRDRIEASMRILEEMGMVHVYGPPICRFILDRHNGDVELAIQDLGGLAKPGKVRFIDAN